MAHCELTGKGPVVKNLVSHSNIKTKKKLLPNVQSKKIFSRVLGRAVTLKVATTTLRSMERAGGIDNFILQLPESGLSRRASTMRNAIKRKVSGKAGKTVKGGTREA